MTDDAFGQVSIRDGLGSFLDPQRLVGHSDAVRFIHYDKENHLITCGSDKTTCLWSTDTPDRKFQPFDTTGPKFKERVTSQWISVFILSPKGPSILSLSAEGLLALLFQSLRETANRITL